jgi:hypothetical protein
LPPNVCGTEYCMGRTVSRVRRRLVLAQPPLSTFLFQTAKACGSSMIRSGTTFDGNMSSVMGLGVLLMRCSVTGWMDLALCR